MFRCHLVGQLHGRNGGRLSVFPAAVVVVVLKIILAAIEGGHARASVVDVDPATHEEKQIA